LPYKMATVAIADKMAMMSHHAYVRLPLVRPDSVCRQCRTSSAPFSVNLRPRGTTNSLHINRRPCVCRFGSTSVEQSTASPPLNLQIVLYLRKERNSSGLSQCHFVRDNVYIGCVQRSATVRTVRAHPAVRSHRFREMFFSMRCAVCLELTSCVCHQKRLTICFQI